MSSPSLLPVAASLHTGVEEELRVVREALAQLWAKQDAQDEQLRSISADVASLHGFRDRAESELSGLRVHLSMVVEVLDEFSGLPPEVRMQFDAEIAAVRAELSRQTSFFDEDAFNAELPDQGAAPVPLAEPCDQALLEQVETSAPDVEDRREAAPSLDELPVAVLDTSASSMPQRSGWLADAIKMVAERRSATLAGELVLELLPFHAKQWGAPLSYELCIEELGRFAVDASDDHVSVVRSEDAEGVTPAFRLAGGAAAFARFAGPGSRAKMPGVHVRGSRRKARRYMSALSEPIVLADLAAADVIVWPGLLLAAMAEAVDPAWTANSRFVVRFEILGGCDAVFEIEAADGAPLAINRPRDHVQAPGDENSLAVVSVSERGFMCLLAGICLPDGEQVRVKGRQDIVHTLIDWFARAQAPSGQPPA